MQGSAGRFPLGRAVGNHQLGGNPKDGAMSAAIQGGGPPHFSHVKSAVCVDFSHVKSFSVVADTVPSPTQIGTFDVSKVALIVGRNLFDINVAAFSPHSVLSRTPFDRPASVFLVYPALSTPIAERRSGAR